MQLLNMFPRLGELTASALRAKIPRTSLGNTANVYDGLLRALGRVRRDKNGETYLVCPYLSDLHLSGMDMEAGCTHLVKALRNRASRVGRLDMLQISAPIAIVDFIQLILERSNVAFNVLVIEEDDLSDGLEDDG